MKRISQPPIDLASRPSEERKGWTGLALAFVASVLVAFGGIHQTDVATLYGNPAWEYQLVKSISSGGLEYPRTAAILDPAVLNDPVAAAAAFERLDRERAGFSDGKPRANPSAAKPCPT